MTSAISSLRVFDKFMVLKSNDMKHSIRSLAVYHGTIVRKYSKLVAEAGNSGSLTFICSIKEFNSALKKSGLATAESIYSGMLRSLPGFGKEAVEKVKSVFKSMRELYEFFNTGTSLDQVQQFLSGFNKEQQAKIIDVLVPDPFK